MKFAKKKLGMQAWNCVLEYSTAKWVQARVPTKISFKFCIFIVGKDEGRENNIRQFPPRNISRKRGLICKWAFSTVNFTREVVNFYKKYSHIFWRYITGSDVWIPRFSSVAIFILRCTVCGDFKGPFPLAGKLFLSG